MYVLLKQDENNLKIEGLSSTPEEGYEEVKSVDVLYHRTWSVGYSAAKEEALTERFAIHNTYNNGKITREGQKNTMGAYEGYYIERLTINGKEPNFWYGYSRNNAYELLEALGINE